MPQKVCELVTPHRKHYRKLNYIKWLTILLNTNTVSYCMQNYKPNRLAPHGPPDASQTIASEMTWSKLLLNYTSPLIQPLMIGLSLILNKKFSQS